MQERQRATKNTALIALFGVWVIGGVTVAGAQEKFTGCLKNNGKIVRVAPGGSPTKPCKDKQTEIMFPGTDKTDALMEADVGLQGQIDVLDARVSELEAKLSGGGGL